MTVTNPLSKQIFQGDGQTSSWSFSFQLPVGSTGSDVYVAIVDNNGNITFLPQVGGNYTLNLNNNSIVYPNIGGISPLPANAQALPQGWQIVIFRTEQIVQLLNFLTQGTYSAASIMAAFDFLTLICQ